MRRPVLSILILCLAVGGGADARTRRDPEIVASGMVASVVDGDTVVLENGSQVRLTGIQAPKLPLGRRGFRAWPLAAQSKAALENLSLGRRLELRYTGRRIDRYGRLLAHLHDAAAGRWIQGEMITLGMARVYSFRDNRARTRDLLTLERGARAARRGIWRLRFYRIRTPEQASRFIDTFQLVEGRVVSAAVVRGRGYLNFGDDWRRDFTISIAPRHRRLFDRAGLAIKSLGGKHVRVRGWLRRYNGPMIDATHPEQIEVLEE